MLLAGGCKPHDLVCETKAVFQAPNPEQGTGAAPFSMERPGPEVKTGMLHDVPRFITLKSDNHAGTEWEHLGHIARNVKHPEVVYPMKRLSDGATERVRFGFRSAACRDPNAWGASFCQFGGDELFLIAEMTCHRE